MCATLEASEGGVDVLSTPDFEYIKIDYNENIGLGADGAESLGEALRQNTLGTVRFMEKLRREVPGPVVDQVRDRILTQMARRGVAT